MCALELSWQSSRPRTSVRGRRSHHAWKTLGKQWLTHQSAITVFLSSRGMVATWPNFVKNHAIICLQAPLSNLKFNRWVLIWEDPHRQLLLRLGVVLVYPGFVSCYDVPKARRPSSVKFSLHVGAQIHPTPLLLFTEVMGHPAGTTFPYAKAVAKNASETSR